MGTLEVEFYAVRCLRLAPRLDLALGGFIGLTFNGLVGRGLRFKLTRTPTQ